MLRLHPGWTKVVGPTLLMLAMLAVLFLVSDPNPAVAKDVLKGEIPTWTKTGVLSGYTAQKSECIGAEQLWIDDGKHSYCIRYFANFRTAPQSGRQVVIFFRGDFLGFDWGTKGLPAFYVSSVDGKAVYQGTKQMLADARGAPFIVVARPGTMGSSGDHKRKFRPSESRVMNLAIDALERKFGFSRVVLAGHSGGALLVANLLTKRKDVSCAVMASGAVSIYQYALDSNLDTSVAALWEDPIDSVSQIVNGGQTLIVLTGKGDKLRPPEYQQKYAAALSAHGLNAHFWVLRKKGDQHDTEWEAVHTATDCAAGKSADAIRRRFKVLNASP